MWALTKCIVTGNSETLLLAWSRCLADKDIGTPLHRCTLFAKGSGCASPPPIHPPITPSPINPSLLALSIWYLTALFSPVTQNIARIQTPRAEMKSLCTNHSAMYICVFPDSTLAVISVRTGFMDAVWIFPRKMRTPWTSTCVMNVCRNKRRSKKRNCTVYVDNLTTKPSMCTVLGQKKKMWVSFFPTLPSFWTSKSRP